MPKLKESEAERKNMITRAYIAKNMELYGFTDEEVATRLMCTRRTFQNKKKRPETFTLKELRKLCAVLKLQDEEKILIL